MTATTNIRLGALVGFRRQPTGSWGSAGSVTVHFGEVVEIAAKTFVVLDHNCKRWRVRKDEPWFPLEESP